MNDHLPVGEALKGLDLVATVEGMDATAQAAVDRMEANGKFGFKARQSGDTLSVEFNGPIGIEGAADEDLGKAIGDWKGDVKITGATLGGSVFEASLIVNRILAHPGRTSYHNTSMTASAGTWVMAACDERTGAPMSACLIHNANVVAGGNRHLLAKVVQQLGEMDDNQASFYAKRTKLSKERAASFMDNETAFSAASSYRHGFYTVKPEVPEKDDAAAAAADTPAPDAKARLDAVNAYRRAVYELAAADLVL